MTIQFTRWTALSIVLVLISCSPAPKVLDNIKDVLIGIGSDERSPWELILYGTLVSWETFRRYIVLPVIWIPIYLVVRCFGLKRDLAIAKTAFVIALALIGLAVLGPLMMHNRLHYFYLLF